MNPDQLKQGILALEEQGAPREDIQAWIDSQKAPAPTKPAKGRGGVAGAVGNFGIGVGKGVASTLTGASELGQRGLNALFGGLGAPKQKVVSLPKHLTEATNTSQRVGKATEQIAEFFIPGAAATKVGKVATSIPRIANMTGKAGTAARFGTNLFAKAGTESAIFGGQTALQEGQFGKKAKDAGVAGGLTSTALSLLGPVGRAISKGTNSTAIRTANSALGETAMKRLPGVKAGTASLGEDVLEEGFKLGTTKGLQKQFQASASKLDDDLTAFLKGFPDKTIRKTDLKPYLSQLFKDAKKAFGETDARTASLRRIIDDMPENMSLSAANEAKRELYQAAKNAFTNPNAGITPQGQKAVARGIKETIEKKTTPVAKIPEPTQAVLEGTKPSPALWDAEVRASREFGATPEDARRFSEAFKKAVTPRTQQPGVSPVTEMNRRLGIASRASDRLATRVAQNEAKALVNIPDILTGMGGFAAGGPLAAIGLPLARRLLSSPAGKLAIAKSLYGANKGFGKASSAELYKALQRVLGTQGTQEILP